ncbi:Protein dip1 [Spathaspora sp. JA1]|nr:Protein dip1 [Spathaspora sp. JA1]
MSDLSFSYDLPIHSFPQALTDSNISTEYDRDFLTEEIECILINSDSSVVNENFSIFIKCIMDNVYTGDPPPTYESLSLLALKLLTSNMFLKNYQFCIGKMFAFLKLFSEAGEVEDEAAGERENLKEFLCIVLLLLLKIKNNSCDDDVEIIPIEELYQTLQDFQFIPMITQFIASQIKHNSSYVLLKFSCDIFFEYLFHIELLNDLEFDHLNQCDLISTVVKYLLENEKFNNYDLDSDDFENEDKLIAYEEVKLLLLINEQYMMRSYRSNCTNKVFEQLVSKMANITRFINLLIYHLNREESNIIKILIVKFLYLIFTTSFVTQMVYLNDLKILIDIFIRELNNSQELNLVYLRVMYPLLMFSQLKEIKPGYRLKELLDLFRNIILNTQDSNVEKLANKCMDIKWLKPPVATVHRDSTSSASSGSLLDEDVNASKESLTLTFTRVASVRASTRNDYHKHTTCHNIQESRKSSLNLILENNHNVFLNETTSNSNTTTTRNILDLPTEYLNKPLPKLPPQYSHNSNSNDSINSLKLKASKKKPPPPPPPPPRTRFRESSTPASTPPPPPPPRRRHLT